MFGKRKRPSLSQEPSYIHERPKRVTFSHRNQDYQERVHALLDNPPKRPRFESHAKSEPRWHMQAASERNLQPDLTPFDIYIILAQCSWSIDLRMFARHGIPEDILEKAKSFSMDENEPFWTKELLDYAYSFLRELGGVCCCCATGFLKELLDSFHRHKRCKCSEGRDADETRDQAPELPVDNDTPGEDLTDGQPYPYDESHVFDGGDLGGGIQDGARQGLDLVSGVSAQQPVECDDMVDAGMLLFATFHE